MKNLLLLVLLTAGLAVPVQAAGQARLMPGAPDIPVARSVGGWIAGGAAAGGGVGFLLGMGAFDQAINSDQKIWTSALVGAAVGGAVGYFVGRERRSGARSPSATDGFERARAAALSDRLAAEVAKSFSFAARPAAPPHGPTSPPSSID